MTAKKRWDDVPGGKFMKFEKPVRVRILPAAKRLHWLPSQSAEAPCTGPDCIMCDYGAEFMPEETLTPPEPEAEPRCECGLVAAGGPLRGPQHSRWCPVYTEET
jgi:hypothetical protein